MPVSDFKKRETAATAVLRDGAGEAGFRLVGVFGGLAEGFNHETHEAHEIAKPRSLSRNGFVGEASVFSSPEKTEATVPQK